MAETIKYSEKTYRHIKIKKGSGIDVNFKNLRRN
jgi:hypothetical protein